MLVTCLTVMYGWGERVGNLCNTSSAKGKHACRVEDIHFFLFTSEGVVEGFYAFEVSPGGIHYGQPWCCYDKLVGTSLTHQTGKNFGNVVRKGRGVLTHDISNCGEWDESGGTRQYQRNTNWLLWNHIQGAALKPGDFFFSINGPDGNRKLRDSDISRSRVRGS